MDPIALEFTGANLTFEHEILFQNPKEQLLHTHSVLSAPSNLIAQILFQPNSMNHCMHYRSVWGPFVNVSGFCRLTACV